MIGLLFIKTAAGKMGVLSQTIMRPSFLKLKLFLYLKPTDLFELLLVESELINDHK